MNATSLIVRSTPIAALLRELLAHATKPEFVYRHTWRPDDFIMWDNRCLMHRAIANYQITAQRRILHRCVVKGGEPYVGAGSALGRTP